MRIEPALQAQVDAQLMERGAFTALELLIDCGRLAYEDYESWRRGEIDTLDGVLMGSTDKIRAELEQAAGYARSIGLTEQPQELQAWRSQRQASAGRSLRISSDAPLQRLIAGRFVPQQTAPQLDLFFDNPVATLTNGIARALSTRNAEEAQRQLDRLYAMAPNHPDLAAFDRLLSALTRLGNETIAEPRNELQFLREITPISKRLLGSQSRDLLTPLWRRLANALAGREFSPDDPELHRTFALSQAQDWAGVSECVLGETAWWQHPLLCLRLAQSSFYRQRRSDALTAWCHLCWRAPEDAIEALDGRRQPDPGIAALWQRFVDSEEDVPTATAPEPALSASDFPAWLLLHEPGLAQQLPADLPTSDSPGEQHYRCVHRWAQARRAGRQEEEMSLRRTLQASHPALFRLLKRSIAS